jgi:3-oxoacyl-[acyl-carrier protein] reductase
MRSQAWQCFSHPGKGDALSQGFGRVALVSGGSRGIGAATVRQLAADGWDISFCHHHDGSSAAEVEKAASELGVRVLAVEADLTRAAEVASWVQRTEQDLGPVEALVSCAGITRDQPLALLADADWRAVIDTNLDGVFQLCRAVLPAMMERRSGRIVTVSSVSAVYGDAAERGARVTRAGIVGFTRALASQTGRYGIRANAVTPSTHGRRTDMTAIWPEGTTARLTEAIALRRFASATEAADRVAFLLSDAAADITGTVVEVQGSIGWPPGGLALEALPGWLGPVERLGVAERAAHRRPVGREQPDLEVRLPVGHRRGDLVVAAEPESEPAVVAGISEQRHQGLIERVARAQHGVHQRAAHSGPLPIGPDRQRAQRQYRLVSDVPPRAQHVPGHVAVGSDGHQRQRRDPRLALPQLVDQGGLRRSVARRTRPGERGGRDRADHLGVGLPFPPDQHRSTMSGRQPGAQPYCRADRGLPYSE